MRSKIERRTLLHTEVRRVQSFDDNGNHIVRGPQPMQSAKHVRAARIGAVLQFGTEVFAGVLGSNSKQVGNQLTLGFAVAVSGPPAKEGGKRWPRSLVEEPINCRDETAAAGAQN